MWDPMRDFEKETLSNGLDVHVSHVSGRPWQVFEFVVHAGSDMDPVGQEGIAHFLEHVVNRHAGIPHNELEALIERTGGHARYGSTGFEATRYKCFVPIHAAEEIVGRFGNMLLGEQLRHGVEIERAVIIREFDDTYSFAMDREMRMSRQRQLFPDTALSRMACPLGTREALTKISLGDLQENRDRYYVPANISIVTAGGMFAHEVVEMLQKTPFGIEKRGARNPHPAPDMVEVFPADNRLNISAADHLGSLPPVDSPGYMTYARIPGVFNGDALGVCQHMLYKVLKDELREKRQWTYDLDCVIRRFRNMRLAQVCIDTIDSAAVHDIE